MRLLLRKWLLHLTLRAVAATFLKRENAMSENIRGAFRLSTQLQKFGRKKL
jgi:hypothetical protein